MKEDAHFEYNYTRSGKLTLRPKSDIEKYEWFLKTEVIYKSPYGTGLAKNPYGKSLYIDDSGAARITPATDFEIALDLGELNPYQGASSNQVRGGDGAGRLFDHPNPEMKKGRWVINPDGTQNYEFQTFNSVEAIVDDATESLTNKINHQEKLAFLAEQERLKKLRDTAKPKKETVFVAPPEPVEIEPIKEAVKYSPLLIAGVVVVVVLFLRRRA
jgi:hypothetical protein